MKKKRKENHIKAGHIRQSKIKVLEYAIQYFFMFFDKRSGRNAVLIVCRNDRHFPATNLGDSIRITSTPSRLTVSPPINRPYSGSIEKRTFIVRLLDSPRFRFSSKAAGEHLPITDWVPPFDFIRLAWFTFTCICYFVRFAVRTGTVLSDSARFASSRSINAYESTHNHPIDLTRWPIKSSWRFLNNHHGPTGPNGPTRLHRFVVLPQTIVASFASFVNKARLDLPNRFTIVIPSMFEPTDGHRTIRFLCHRRHRCPLRYHHYRCSQSNKFEDHLDCPN